MYMIVDAAFLWSFVEQVSFQNLLNLCIPQTVGIFGEENRNEGTWNGSIWSLPALNKKIREDAEVYLVHSWCADIAKQQSFNEHQN